MFHLDYFKKFFQSQNKNLAVYNPFWYVMKLNSSLKILEKYEKNYICVQALKSNWSGLKKEQINKIGQKLCFYNERKTCSHLTFCPPNMMNRDDSTYFTQSLPLFTIFCEVGAFDQRWEDKKVIYQTTYYYSNAYPPSPSHFKSPVEILKDWLWESSLRTLSNGQEESKIFFSVYFKRLAQASVVSLKKQNYQFQEINKIFQETFDPEIKDWFVAVLEQQFLGSNLDVKQKPKLL